MNSRSILVALVEKYYRKLGEKSLLGWDYARYIALRRWGYLSEREAWERIMPAARLLQRVFGSWRELGENYLVGQEFASLRERHPERHLDRATYQRPLDDPASPWRRHAWETNLDRPGAELRTAPGAR